MGETPSVDRRPGGAPDLHVDLARPTLGRTPRLTRLHRPHYAEGGARAWAPQGDIMSAAKQIKEIRPRLEWLAVEDHDGRVWRYRRVGPLDIAEPAHVEGHYADGHPTRAVLVRDLDGHARLHGDGMPRSIVVEHVDDPTSPLMSLLGLSPKEEYELVG